MTAPQLHIWRTLGRALYAPFSLSLESWKSLAKPVLLLIASIACLITAGYLQVNSTIPLLINLPVFASVAWFALDFQRHLLLEGEGYKPESGILHNYGVYLIVMIVICIFYPLIFGTLLYMVWPAIVFFSMALNSPNPLLASGIVVLWILVIGAAAYPFVRFAMILPAVSAGHGISLKRIWKLSHGKGLKLLFLLVLVPGLINGLLYLAFELYFSRLWIKIIAGILETYLFLFYLSILALSYGELSALPLATVRRFKTASKRILGSWALWPSASILLVGLCLALALDTVYKIEPGKSVIVSRLKKPVRVTSDPGINLKIPFIEQTQQVSVEESYKTEGDGRFFTFTKNSISLKYAAYWHIIDADTFFRATAGQSNVVDRRLEDMLHHELRDKISRLNQNEMQDILSAGKKKFGIKDDMPVEPPLDEVLNDVNSRVRELGIEMTSWDLEIDSQN